MATPKASFGWRDLYARQVAFWTARTDGSPAAIYRIAFGVLGIWAAVGVLLNLERYFGEHALLPWRVVAGDRYIDLSLISWAPASEGWLHLLGYGFLAASVCLTLGLGSRLSMFLVWLLWLTFQTRNPLILNSGDRLFGILTGLGIFLPLGHRFSLDSAIRKLRGKKRRKRVPAWCLKLIQLEIAYVYWVSFFSKLPQPRWQQGLALQDVLASPIYAEWPMHVGGPWVHLLSYGTLLFELAFPVLIWWKPARHWLLLAGVFFHVGIDLLMTIPMFSAVMICSYAVYLDDELAKRWLDRLRLPWFQNRTPSRAAADPEQAPDTA